MENNKNISEFFKTVDLSYLKVSNEIDNENFKNIWEKVYKPSQDKKIKDYNINEETKKAAFNGLSKRGKFLCDISNFFGVKNIAEVGTAEGFQFYTFAENFKESKDSFVYTCDIRDVRHPDFVNKYNNAFFVFGNSKEMSKKIANHNKKIDLFWIDGAHHNSAVLFDVITLSKVASKNCIWIFDDFNERFGAFNELNFLKSMAEESYIISLGPTASGKPNNMLITKGF